MPKKQYKPEEIVAKLRQVRREGRCLWLRRAGSGLRRDRSQEPGLGVSCHRHPRADAALPHVAAQPALHRRDARQAVGRAGREKEGGGHRRPQCVRTASVVEVERMARRGKR